MRATIAGLTAVCAATMAGLLLGFAGGLDTLRAWSALAAGGFAGWMAWWSVADLPKGEAPRGWAAWGVGVVFALFALRAFCWLLFAQEGELFFLSPNNLGDLSLHLTYIRAFAHGAPFWPENPIYAGTPLHYPFGVDLWNALLLLAGADLQRGLVWTGLLGSLAAAVALWRWGGAFAMGGFLFNGGIAGFAFLSTHKLADYQEKLDWKNIPLALFVTQRGLLYAVPAGLILLWSWRARLLEGRRGLPFWIECLLYATLPLFHLHTFLFLSALLGCWLCLPAGGGVPSPRGAIFRLGLCAFLPASALVWLLTGGGVSGGMIHVTGGWMQADDGVFRCAVENFGALPLAVGALLAWLWRRRGEPETRALAVVALPSLLLFGITCFVVLAEWAWDNTKLMLWAYLAVLPALWAMLREQALWLRAAAIGLLFFSGAVSLLGGLDGSHTGYTLAREEELDQLEAALTPFPITATFACMPTYNHPLLLLGHKVVAGYEGHLSSHGIPYQARFAALESVLRGEPGWESRARTLGADYLFWGPREREKYGGASPWQSPATAGAPVAAEGPWGRLYALTPPHPAQR
ncbi:MAG: hypothetical protein WCH57_01915 [Verrucomicrobiota bacterium]